MNLSLHYPYIFKHKSDEKKDNISYGMSPQILRSKMKINIWILQWKVYFFIIKRLSLATVKWVTHRRLTGDVGQH